MIKYIRLNNFINSAIDNQNLLGNQSQIFIFAYDCVYGSTDSIIPSIAYVDVLLSILYCFFIIIIGQFLFFISS